MNYKMSLELQLYVNELRESVQNYKFQSNFTKYYKNTNVFKLSKRQVSLWLACLTASRGSKKSVFNSWSFGWNQPLLQQGVIVRFHEY